jgi:hypothetical protein
MPTNEALEALFSNPPQIHGVQFTRDPHQTHRLIADVHGCECSISAYDDGVQWLVCGYGQRRGDYGVTSVADAAKAAERGVVEIARTVRGLLSLVGRLPDV